MTESRPCIRRARPQEAAELSALALRSKAHWPYTQAFIEACRTPLTLSAAYVARSPVFVLERVGAIAGFYGFDRGVPEAVLEFLYVDPAAIGCGYGKLLWQHAVQHARGAGVRAFTIAADPNAEAFYLAMGAVRIGVTPSEVDARRLLPLLRYEVQLPAMRDGTQHPPLEPLREIATRLSGAGIPFALGGSGLLACLGLEERVRDWDLTLDASWERVGPLVRDLDHELCEPQGIYATAFLCKVDLDGAAFDLMGDFAIRTEEGVCRIPVLVGCFWNGIPLASPEVWAVTYLLIGRAAKAERLFAYLRERGADLQAVERILQEPLPHDVARALRALPTS